MSDLEGVVRYLAEIHDINIEDLLIAQRPGVRHDMPSTFDEFRVWSELNDES